MILQNPMFRRDQSRLDNSRLGQAFFEPLVVVAACLMWVTILPITSIVCAGVDVYDKVTSSHWA